MRTATILLLLTAATLAQEKKDRSGLERDIDDYVSAGKLPELQVTATRLAQDPFEVPRAITVVTPEEYFERRPQVAVQILDQRIGVWIEQRTTTTADPIMRGFAGAALLALIDGNTLTTLWGEGGFGSDDMYGKIDAYLVDRIEVVRGPTSFLYGSNNLGGVLNFLMRSSRYDYTEKGHVLGGRLYADVGSADTSARGRLEHHGASERFRWLLGLSVAAYEDLRAGGDVGLQVPTSGEDLFFDLKVQHRISERSELEVFLQRADRDHTHRFYRPTQDNFNDRLGTGVTYRSEGLGSWWVDQIEARFYYQHKKDTRRFLSQNRRGWAKTDTFVIGVQLSTPPGRHRVTYGVSWERDYGESPDDEQFTMHTKGMTDLVKDAPDSIWDDVGIYVQDEWTVSPKWTLIGAARIDFMHFKTIVDQFYDPPGPLDPADDSYSENINAPSGGLGVLYRWKDWIHLLGNVSVGFRQFAPKFGATQVGAGIRVPNRLLDPVNAVSFELGTKIRRRGWWLDVFVYRSEIYNWQTERPGTFQGQDFFDWNGNGTFDPDERVIVVVPEARAYVTGVELEGWLNLSDLWSRLPRGLSLRGGFAYNYGNDRTANEPMRFVHPTYAIVGLRYDRPDGKWWVEFLTKIVRHADRIPSDRAGDPGFFVDPQDPTSGLLRADLSIPGYTVFVLRGGVLLTKDVRLEIALENLTDKEYRSLHSRMDAPGFNARVGITIDF
ncbi:MAG: TonB-dependent receptor [Planctomycetota bacterium]